MADWQRKIDLAGLHRDYRDGKITVQRLAADVASAVRASRHFGGDLSHVDDARDEIADAFEALSEDAMANIDDYDAILGDLYDWGDARLDSKWNGKKVAWINTI